MNQYRDMSHTDADIAVLRMMQVEPDHVCGLCHAPDKEVVTFKGIYVCGDCIKYIRNCC